MLKGRPRPAALVTVVRRARPEDGPAFLRLVQELADYERLAGPTPEAQARLLDAAFGAGRRFDLFVAERAGEVVAYAATFEAYSTFLARPVLYLEDLFVSAAARRQGVARALMRALAREALARGCARVAWVVLDWNTDAQRFYDGLGARPQKEWLPYVLDGEALAAMAREAQQE